MKPRLHIFVCTTDRPPFARPSCARRGAREVLRALAEEVESRGLAAEVAVTSSGCLGPCEAGPTVVVYPEGTWYRGVAAADAAEIVRSHQDEGRPVARLLHAWPSIEPGGDAG